MLNQRDADADLPSILLRRMIQAFRNRKCGFEAMFSFISLRNYLGPFAGHCHHESAEICIGAT